MNNKTSRRRFLKNTSLMTAGLMVGFKLNSPKIIVAKDVSDLNPHFLNNVSLPCWLKHFFH